MRIIFLSDLPPYDGGSGYSGAELQSGLSKKGCKIFTIAPLYPDRCYGERLTESGNYKHVKVKYPRGKRLLKKDFEKNYWDTLINKANSLKPELILANSGGFVPTACLLSREINIPFAVIIRGYPVWSLMSNEPKSERFESVILALKKAEKIITVSHCLSHELKINLNLSSVTIKNVPYLPYSINNDLPFNERNIDILFVGTFTDRKRPYEVISICKKSGLRNLNVLLVGHGPALNYLKKSIPNITSIKFLITGFKERSLVLEYMSKSKLLILPSLNEGDPRVILEAAAFGTPSLIPKLKWSEEIKLGVIKSSSTVDAANKVRKILTETNYWQKFSRDACRKTSERNGNNVIDEYERVLKEIIQ